MMGVCLNDEDRQTFRAIVKAWTMWNSNALKKGECPNTEELAEAAMSWAVRVYMTQIMERARAARGAYGPKPVNREAVRLVRDEGLSFGAAAKVLGVTRNAVAGAVYREDRRRAVAEAAGGLSP